MASKIWDPSVLDRRSGTFKLMLELPESVHAEVNPDGSRPQITLHVETEGKVRHSLVALNGLSEDEDQHMFICWDFGMKFAPDALTQGWESPDTPTQEQLDAVMRYVREDWSAPVELAIAAVEVPELGDAQVKISVTVPSAQALMYGLSEWLSKRMLNSVLSSFMPDLDDDDDFDDVYDFEDEDES